MLFGVENNIYITQSVHIIMIIIGCPDCSVDAISLNIANNADQLGAYFAFLSVVR